MIDYRDVIGTDVHIVMDRPIGTVHPKHSDLVYPINYGYVPNVMGGDGEEQDVYLLGVNEMVMEYDARIIAVIHRLNDNEDKWVAAPSGMSCSREEILEQVKFQEQYYISEIYM